MIKKGLILVCVFLLVAACNPFKKKKPPPAPEPTRVVLEFEATGNINPNSEGRASPLVVRIYRLKSYSVFEDADFFSLYEKADEALGGELIDKEEILLNPNEKRTVFFEASDDLRTVGIFGVFRDYEQGQWKAAAGVKKNKTNIINVFVNGTNLTIK
jgi:type VI secretion system protein VasD